jgi:hypothetical protein
MNFQHSPGSVLYVSISERMVICSNKAFLRKFQYEEPERNVINISIEDVCSVLQCRTYLPEYILYLAESGAVILSFVDKIEQNRMQN